MTTLATSSNLSTAIEPDRHDERLDHDGYTVVPGALSPDQLAPIRRRYDELMALKLEEIRRKNAAPIHAEINRILEQDAVFEQLMDHPPVFGIVRRAIGADITLAGGGEADYRLPHTPARLSWHSDFEWLPDLPRPRPIFWIRTTYFIDDVTDEMSPFTVVPGTHRADHRCPAEYTLPGNQPCDIPGQVRVTGDAGTCLINNTEIWHTNTVNRSDRARKVIMLTYKHAWMRQWEDGYELTRAFGERQSTPLRRQLCGVGVWHRWDEKWDA